MRKSILLYLLAYATLLAFPRPTLADGCTPIYGGGEMCQPYVISMQKLVLNPQTNQFVHSLSQNDPHYFPGDILTFQIKVTNISSNAIPSITVTDMFPQYMTFSSAPGAYNAHAHTLTSTINNLDTNKTATITILGRIVGNNQLPAQNITCVTNRIVATTNADQTFQDSSGYCIEKRTTGMTTYPSVHSGQMPATGPEALPLLALLPAAGIGLVLRKKSRNASQ